MWITGEISIFAEILLAGFFGSLVGMERELAEKPAGLRTHILVAMAASLLVALGSFIIRESDSRVWLQQIPSASSKRSL